MTQQLKCDTPEQTPIELTVLIPVYNEAETIEEIVRRVMLALYHKQIIIVDNCSTDGTADLLEGLRDREGVEIHKHSTHRGTGAAIRTGLEHARGRFTIIQDADLEYDPQDYPLLIELLRRGESKIVYGSRYMNAENKVPITIFSIGGKFLNMLVWVLFGTKIADESTRYKAFETDVLRSLSVRCEAFEFCPEVTAKALKRGYKIIEVPIGYKRRTYAEGKKIGVADGFQAIWTLFKYRLVD